MGLFDFLKSNKNMITDNGTNYIYYDNGTGSIKEKFSKINGVLNGEYVQYNRNGTFNIKTYMDGIIQLTEEEILIKNREEEINKNIKVEISKLKIIDDLISEVSGIFLLVQMENSKIDYYSNLINEKYGNIFDQDYIKFYLYTKRNYFIKHLIEYNRVAKMEVGESFDEIKTVNYYNKRFTEQIINYSNDYLKFENHLHNIKVNYSDSFFLKHSILNKLFKNFNVTNNVNISYDGKSIDKKIFNQQSILFGLDIHTYKIIYEIIEKRSNEFKYNSEDSDNVEFTKDLFEKLEDVDNILNNKIILNLKPSQQDLYAQNVADEILSICVNNKVKQEDIILKL
jgi:hypothetical protein